MQFVKQGLPPDDIQYIETHGTGTKLGDPIEVNALNKIFQGDHKVYLGSVKSNLGHMESVAGLASVLKAVLMMEYGIIPKKIHYDTPNPLIAWEKTPFVINTENVKWDTKQKTVGISSFGLSGTNVHVILQREEASIDQFVHTFKERVKKDRNTNDHGERNGHGIEGGRTVEEIRATIKDIIYETSGLEQEELDDDVNLFSFGLDSLMLIQIKKKIDNHYNVELPVERIMSDIDTIQKVADYIIQEKASTKKDSTNDRNTVSCESTDHVASTVMNAENNQVAVDKAGQSVEAVREERAQPVYAPVEQYSMEEAQLVDSNQYVNVASTSQLESFMSNQLNTVAQTLREIATQQLNALSGARVQMSQARPQATMPMTQPVNTVQNVTNKPQVEATKQPELCTMPAKVEKKNHPKINFRAVKLDRDIFTPQQKEFIQRFIKRYNEKTKSSKKYAEDNRKQFF